MCGMMRCVLTTLLKQSNNCVDLSAVYSLHESNDLNFSKLKVINKAHRGLSGCGAGTGGSCGAGTSGTGGSFAAGTSGTGGSFAAGTGGSLPGLTPSFLRFFPGSLSTLGAAPSDRDVRFLAWVRC